MLQDYEFLKDTRKYTKGQVVPMSPAHKWTKQRLERGIIRAVRSPEPKREKKVRKPAEVKDDSQNE